mgnify:CR=1 FL=1
MTHLWVGVAVAGILPGHVPREEYLPENGII